MGQVVRTACVPPAERFDFWQQLVCQVAMPIDVRSPHADNFVASVSCRAVGPLKILIARNPPVDADRTPQLIRRADPGVYHVALDLGGRQLSQAGNVVSLAPGEMVLYDSSRPFFTRAEPGRTRESAIAVVIPHALLPLPPDKVEHLLATRLPGRGGLGGLVAGYLRALATADVSAAAATRLAFVTLDLLSVMLASRLGSDRAVSVESRERALLARIQAFITARLGDPELGPESIAVAHHLSLRTLHRLFQAHDVTVAGWIRTRRLERCRRDLADPQLRWLSAQAIAARWGFSNAAHFSRAFRAAYGISPAAVRLIEARSEGVT